MNLVNLRDVPEVELRSPGGRFRSFARNISLALGGVRHAGVGGGGHPFDLQLRRVPPGAAICPFHRHAAQWELFVVLAGEATVRCDGGWHDVQAGDAFLHPPGVAHQFINDGAADVEVAIIADNPPVEACYYPDSDKWGLRPPGMSFFVTECDYFEGEEEDLEDEEDVEEEAGPPAAPPPVTAGPEAPPFDRRRVAIESLAWETWESPRGRFRAAGRQVSVALGARPRTPVGQGGHPFDLEIGRVPPGASPCPFHSHSLQWELYWFTAGRGSFRLGDETFGVEAGDVVLARPGVPHTFTNTGDADLHYWLVTDDPLVEFWHYPDSGKWGFSAPRKIFRAIDVGYLDGEE